MALGTILMIALGFDVWVRLTLLMHRPGARRIAALNRLVRLWGRSSSWAVRTFLGTRLVVEGHRPLAERHLIITNHQSSADIPLLISVFRECNLKFVALEKLRHGKPAVSPALRHGGFAFVTGKKLRADLKQLALFGKQMERFDACPLIFPEGERTTDGSLQPFHFAGVETIRRTSRLPLLPVIIDGLWAARTLAGYQRLVGATVTVRILDPIPFEEAQRNPREVYQAIEEQMRRGLEALRARGGS